MLVLVAESDPEEDSERGEEDEGRVEEDVAGLRDKSVLECDEERGEERSGCSAVERAQCEVGQRDCCDAQGRWKHTHCDVGHIFVNSVEDLAGNFEPLACLRTFQSP